MTAPDNITPPETKPPIDVVAVNLLNELFKLDPAACSELVQHRVDCNPSVADHATIQVELVKNKDKVGLIGVLNGILDLAGASRVAMIIDGTKLVGFTIYQPPK